MLLRHLQLVKIRPKSGVLDLKRTASHVVASSYEHTSKVNMACPPFGKKLRFAKATYQLVAALAEDATPKSTDVGTPPWVSVFKGFGEEKGVGFNLETCTAVELNDALGQFCDSLRTKEPGRRHLQESTYLSAHAAMGCYVSKDMNCPFDIFQTPELQASNRVLDSVLKKNMNDGVERQVEHR